MNSLLLKVTPFLDLLFSSRITNDYDSIVESLVYEFSITHGQARQVLDEYERRVA